MKNRLDYLMKALGHKSGESICLVYDEKYSTITSLVEAYCENLDIAFNKILLNHKDEFGDEIKDAFTGDVYPIIILAVSENIWHTKERKIAKYDKKKRLANILHPDEPCLSYTASYEYMTKLGSQLETLLKNSKIFRAKSESGTDIIARIGKVFCETGDYTKPGSGGDFPAGEVGFGPIEGSVKGRAVYDFKIQHVGSHKPKHIIEVDEDKMTVIDASEEFRKLIERDPVLKFISEISIGINPIWSDEENTQSIVEEKNIGTMHFGHGANLSYGNRTGSHFDSVITKPTIYLDGICIMKKGVFNRKYINI